MFKGKQRDLSWEEELWLGFEEGGEQPVELKNNLKEDEETQD